MAISGFVSIPEWGRDSEREGGGAHPARLRPQDAEEVVGKRRRHIRSALPDTQNHPIVSARRINLIIISLYTLSFILCWIIFHFFHNIPLSYISAVIVTYVLNVNFMPFVLFVMPRFELSH